MNHNLEHAPEEGVGGGGEEGAGELVLPSMEGVAGVVGDNGELEVGVEPENGIRGLLGHLDGMGKRERGENGRS